MIYKSNKLIPVPNCGFNMWDEATVAKNISNLVRLQVHPVGREIALDLEAAGSLVNSLADLFIFPLNP